MMNTNNATSAREAAEQIFRAGVESVKPDNLIRQFVAVRDGRLVMETLSWPLADLKRIYVIGAGKASALMAQSVEAVLGGHITAGHIVTKHGHGVALKRIGTTEAGHPVPDEHGVRGTAAVLALAEQAAAGDLVLCLLSGGGSALLADVPPGGSLADLKALNDLLLRCGADIREINGIRKHLSKVKGGQLARAVQPATLVSLILSDVVGDPLDVIASGPTAPDPSTFAEALAALDKYGIRAQVPPSLRIRLEEGAAGLQAETPKAGEALFENVHNLVIGTNRLALAAARERAVALGYETRVVTSTLAGDTADAARMIVAAAREAQAAGGGKVCLLFGGEPTVKVAGHGLGGRNQHLALLAAGLLAEIPGITVLSAGTDGSDGPTDAAGAVADAGTLARARELGLDWNAYRENCDSYHFFAQTGGLIRTGPTQTNVMDLMVGLVEGGRSPRSKV